AIKLCAIAVCSAAVAGTIASQGMKVHLPVDATLIAWHFVFLSYFALFAIFFDLDMQEVLLSCCIVIMVQLGVSVTLAKLLDVGIMPEEVFLVPLVHPVENLFSLFGFIGQFHRDRG